MRGYPIQLFSSRQKRSKPTTQNLAKQKGIKSKSNNYQPAYKPKCKLPVILILTSTCHTRPC